MRKSFFREVDKRFFFLYGNTDDEFCTADLRFRNINELLFYQLKSLGYTRVALYDPKNKIYTYEKTSYDAILNPKIVKKNSTEKIISPLIPAGPLGTVSLLSNEQSKTTSDHSAEIRNNLFTFGLMNDQDVVAKLDEIMIDSHIKTALIFSDGFDFFSNFEHNARRQMAANLTNWLKFGHTNENICVFVLPNLQGEQLHGMLQKNSHWEFLFSKMFKQGFQLSDSMFFIGFPKKDEIENLMHYYRIKYNYQIDWRAFTKYLPKIASYLLFKQITLKAFGGNIKTRGDLSQKTLIKLAGTPDDETAEMKLETMRGISVIKDKIDDFIDEINELKIKLPVKNQLAKTLNLFFTDRTSSVKQDRFDMNLHVALKGAPGTGKTTVAKLFGEIFRERGLLSSGHLVKASREDLVAEYVGHTAIKTAQLVNQAMGGILFVDEAYRLVGSGTNDFGAEALGTILEAMSNHKGEFSVIFAGYPDEIDKVIESNPGFKSRFSEHNIITIPNFDSETLYKILEDTVKADNKKLNNELKEKLPYIIKNWHHTHQYDKTFGNARAIKEEIYKGMDNKRRKRIRNKSTLRNNQFIFEDIPDFLETYIYEKESLKDVLNELNNLTGLSAVKNQIDKLVQQVNVQKLRKKQGLKIQKDISMHMLFMGNPGTGKTTVARLMGKIFNGLEILPSDKLLDVSAKDLIGNHVGESEDKAQKIIKKAMGGVLFIDEIYGLTQGSLGKSYGADVINNVLVPAMTKYEGKLLIIGAGYTEDINHFLDANAGLGRRFSRKINFEDFTSKELLMILKKYAKNEDYTINASCEDKLLALFSSTKQLKEKFFGNAGTAITCFDLMVENQGIRLNNKKECDISKQDLKELLIEDVPQTL